MKKIKIKISGRPGWHIECSTMSMKYLKTETLDIHAGGRDLIFPHHENEIAQSEAITGKPFAKYWIHHGLLTINGQKMAKSLGNFVTLQDFLGRFKNPDLLKLFFLSAHYASPVDYSDQKVEEAMAALERIVILLDKAAGYKLQVTSHKFEEIESLKEKFFEAMDDDFNTPKALASVFELVNLANKRIDDGEFAGTAGIAIKELLSILGIGFKPAAGRGGLSEAEVKAKIEERNNARKNKDYKLSDKIRIELEEQGVILEDSKDGTAWRRKL